jgi:predicted dehydrogenase
MVSQRGLVAMIGCQFRFHPLLVRLQQVLASGELGTVLGARAEWGEYLPDWHPWEDHRQSYSARADLGGGVVLTLIHPLDYLYWLFGPVSRTHASTGRIAALETPAGEDWAEVTLEFASGVIGQIHLDYWQRPAVHRLTVWGDRGRADLNFEAGTLRWELGKRAEGRGVSEAGVRFGKVSEGFERNSLFLDEMRHFLDCIAKRREPAVPLADGIAVLKLALAAKQSAREGRSHE